MGADARAGRTEAEAAAAVLVRDAGRAEGRAGAGAGQSPARIGEASSAAALRRDGTGEPLRQAGGAGGWPQAAKRLVSVSATAVCAAGAALRRLRAQVAEGAAPLRHRRRRHRTRLGSATSNPLGHGHAGAGAAVFGGSAPFLIRAAARGGGAPGRPRFRRLAASRATVLVAGAELERRVTAGESLTAAGGIRSAHAGATAAVGGGAAGFAGHAAERKQLASGRAAFRVGDAELAAAVGVGGARLTRRTTAGAGRGAGAGRAGAVATVAVAHAAASGRRAGRFTADSVHATQRATVARPRAGLLLGGAAGGVETDELAAARRIDPAEEGATVGVEVTGGTVAMANGQRRAAPGGAETRAAVAGARTGAAVGGAGGARTRARRRQLDVTPAAEGRSRQREQRSRLGQLGPGQGCAPVPASRRAVATRRPLGNVAR
jgi:hypothetical protein